MATFIQVCDPACPAVPPWWTVLIPHNDHEALFLAHRWFSRKFWIDDGRDPHNQAERDRAARENTLSIADLRHPVRLSGQWMETAMSLFVRGDVLVSSRGGMRPRDEATKELAVVEAKDWPAAFSTKRHIALTTWGNHWYLVCADIAFAEKYDSEQAAMDVAKRFAPVANITVKREARDYRQGD